MFAMSPSTFSWLVVLLSGATASYLMVALLRRVLTSLDFVDLPNERSSHDRPTTRGGGLAIVATTLVGLAALNLVYSVMSWRILLSYVLGSGMIALVSLLDDWRPISPRIRIVVHVAGAMIAVAGIGYFESIGIPGLTIGMGQIGILLTIAWIVGLTNAYNFMDGIDGIAGAQAIVAGFSWAVTCRIAKVPDAEVIALLLAAASIGFVIHNWPPARIFMGDVGSAFIGYTLAVLPLVMLEYPPRGVSLEMVPIGSGLVLLPFIFDTSFTLLRRLLSGESIVTAHRSHLYQRLVQTGWSHQTVTVIYLQLMVVSSVAGVMWMWEAPYAVLTLILSLLLCIILLGVVNLRDRRNQTKR